MRGFESSIAFAVVGAASLALACSVPDEAASGTGTEDGGTETGPSSGTGVSAASNPTDPTDPTVADGTAGSNSEGSATSGPMSATNGPPMTASGSDTDPMPCSSAADCDDGDFCNGEETCDPGSGGADAQGCVAGVPPCRAPLGCDDTIDMCVDECDVDRDQVQAIACGGVDCDDGDSNVGLETAGGSCVDARRVFTTSETHDGNLGGAGGADGTCQDVADATGLGGTWLAFIVDSGNALDRHSQATVPYIRLDGVRLADDWADLTDGSVAATPNLDEDGQQVGSNAWTGLKQVGGGGAANCNDWSTAQFGCLQGGPCGAAGETGQTDGHWQGWYVFHCSDEYRLYCIEQ